jgi:hypothetical protein
MNRHLLFSSGLLDNSGITVLYSFFSCVVDMAVGARTDQKETEVG